MAISSLARSLMCSGQDRVPLPLANTPSGDIAIFCQPRRRPCPSAGRSQPRPLAQWQPHPSEGGWEGDSLLPGDKPSLGRTSPSAPLALSFQFGRSDILLSPPPPPPLLPVYLAVQIGFDEDSFFQLNRGRVPQARSSSVLALGPPS